jgi:glucosamine-6-phosphate deaminase
MNKKTAPSNPSDSFEKIPVQIFSDSKAGSAFVARQIADFIREKQKKKENVF